MHVHAFRAVTAGARPQTVSCHKWSLTHHAGRWFWGSTCEMDLQFLLQLGDIFQEDHTADFWMLRGSSARGVIPTWGKNGGGNCSGFTERGSLYLQDTQLRISSETATAAPMFPKILRGTRHPKFGKHTSRQGLPPGPTAPAFCCLSVTRSVPLNRQPGTLQPWLPSCQDVIPKPSSH